jgi:hypothetical protein
MCGGQKRTKAVACSRFEKVLGFDLVELNIGLHVEQRRFALTLQLSAGDPPDSLRERLLVWLQALKNVIRLHMHCWSVSQFQFKSAS